MANEFNVKNGLIVEGNSTMKGSSYGMPALSVEGTIYVHDFVDNTSTIMTAGGPLFKYDGPAGYLRIGSSVREDYLNDYTKLGYGNMYWVYLSNDKVGIGTTSPVETLDVSGNIKTSGFLKVGNTNSGTIYLADSTSNFISGGTAAGGIDITYDGTNGIFLTKVSGKPRVGILNVAPEETLHVKGTVRIGNSLTLDNSPTFLYPTADVKFGTAGTTYIKGSSDTNTLKIGTAGSDRIYIAADGKIGIGTTNPAYDFDVPVITSNFFQIRHTDLTLTYYNYNFWSTNGFDGNYIISSTDPFATPNSSAFMIHRNSETVGIGSWLTEYNNDQNVYQYGFGAKLAVKNDALNTSGNIISAKNIDGNQVFTLMDIGFVGILTTTPSTHLDVRGDISFGNGSYGTIFDPNGKLIISYSPDFGVVGGTILNINPTAGGFGPTTVTIGYGTTTNQGYGLEVGVSTHFHQPVDVESSINVFNDNINVYNGTVKIDDVDVKSLMIAYSIALS